MDLTSTSLPRARVARYHRIDGWRGYSVPAYAIAGSSDTGTWSDSPAPTPDVMAELRRFRRALKEATGITTRVRTGGSSNAFCGKRWVTVTNPYDYPQAAQFALDYIERERDCRFIHDAEQGQLGYRANTEH